MLQFSSEENFYVHCAHVDLAATLIARGQFDEAIAALDAALLVGESPNARWNRALALLAVGRWTEGFVDYGVRWELLARPWARTAELMRDLPIWRGELLANKRLIVVHEAGFGDSIMLARYVKVLQYMGIEVALAMPPQLTRLLGQLAPDAGPLSERDFYCCTYDIMRLLEEIPRTVPTAPYLRPEPALVSQWRKQLFGGRQIGVAWSSARDNRLGRNIPLPQFMELLALPPDCTAVSLQAHDKPTAHACGVRTLDYTDFADVAAVAAQMDAIVSIDTAALHVAGAIGHSRVYGLLPHVHCWRWYNGAPWYPTMKLCKQTAPGDWASAFKGLDDGLARG